ncbi:PREDICTED: uncharacterized protein LOC106117781 [Papilio xuthus]|uniref:Uncharacterized protein LOC106117781 n=1 Tax=Papilio xuthus TaxID=66420 RepID=A0AAJ6Z971_PAPXU|nr:PREDICTED: uncharacterized protein LOC106117781 [Papilio xuthus]
MQCMNYTATLYKASDLQKPETTISKLQPFCRAKDKQRSSTRASVQPSTPSWRTTKGCDYIGARATRLPHAGLRFKQHPEGASRLRGTIIGASDKQQSTRVTSPFVYVYAATCALHSSDKSPLTSLPSPSFLDCNANRLSRFQHLEQIRQHFWKRWTNEYIAELQQRSKWRAESRHLKIDDLVLVKEDNAPPLCWRLGRVNRLYPGPDDVPRVADVVTSQGTVRRALNRLCFLPSSEEDLS